jgi:hypothetical protein
MYRKIKNPFPVVFRSIAIHAECGIAVEWSLGNENPSFLEDNEPVLGTTSLLRKMLLEQ